MGEYKAGREALTPRPETGELLEVGLGTIDRKSRDDLLHFILVDERAKDYCNRIKTMSTNVRDVIKRITIRSREALVRVPEFLSISAMTRESISPRNNQSVVGCLHVEEIQTLGLNLDLTRREQCQRLRGNPRVNWHKVQTFSYSVIHTGSRPSS